MTDLSILICGTHTRVETTFPAVYSFIAKQAEGLGNVQVLALTDNKVMSVGEKRTRLIELAHGNYICFVDDDDMVSSDYVQQLLEAIKENTDVVCFRAYRYVDKTFDREVKYGVQYRKDGEDNKYYYRIPNHLMCFKKTIAMQHAYPFVNFGEDAMWARSVFYDIKTQHTIDKVLYHYYFSPQTTETQK